MPATKEFLASKDEELVLKEERKKIVLKVVQKKGNGSPVESACLPARAARVLLPKLNSRFPFPKMHDHRHKDI